MNETTALRGRRTLGLDEFVPSLWVESEREYDHISAVYGISTHRSQMRSLSVISAKRLFLHKEDFTMSLRPEPFVYQRQKMIHIEDVEAVCASLKFSDGTWIHE
ncbi:hypothetical protein Tco_1417704 [Tanacetum coccineum]